MVEYTLPLDSIFGALADPTRRDILRRVARAQLNVSELAQDYNLTFAAVSKHLMVLEQARLIIKRRQGRHQLIQAHPTTLKQVDDYLAWYRQLWEGRLDALDAYLKEREAYHGRKTRTNN